MTSHQESLNLIMRANMDRDDTYCLILNPSVSKIELQPQISAPCGGSFRRTLYEGQAGTDGGEGGLGEAGIGERARDFAG